MGGGGGMAMNVVHLRKRSGGGGILMRKKYSIKNGHGCGDHNVGMTWAVIDTHVGGGGGIPKIIPIRGDWSNVDFSDLTTRTTVVPQGCCGVGPGQEDVVGLEVPMEDILVVDVLERLQHLGNRPMDEEKGAKIRPKISPGTNGVWKTRCF